ncbi:ABC transporter permease [Streptomyces thermolilacinus]|uniref:ABC transporter permease n=1 Tax=Streptomyces thermolilacinus TaxID=285540 RepID=UPI0033EBDB2D
MSVTLEVHHRQVVRLHRTALRTLAALGATALVVLGGLRLWAATARDEAACAAGDWQGCEDRLFNGQGTPSGLLRLALEYASLGLLFLPVLIGAFVAGPMIARELESGTYRLAWTQSAAPSRWLTSRLVVPVAAAAAGAVAVSAVFRFAVAPLRESYAFGWHVRGVYEVLGPVLAAQCALAVCVGAVMGLLVRRTVAAMAVTGAATGLILLVTGAARWHLWPTVTTTSGDTSRAGVTPAPHDALVRDTGFLTENGRLPLSGCWERTGGGTPCTGDGIIGRYAVHHPSAHFWPLQLVETGILLAVAALAALAAYRLLARRHA